MESPTLPFYPVRYQNATKCNEVRSRALLLADVLGGVVFASRESNQSEIHLLPKQMTTAEIGNRNATVCEQRITNMGFGEG
jgi:hypothetical protein